MKGTLSHFSVIVALALALRSIALQAEEQPWPIASPNGLVQMTLRLSDAGQVSYQVEYGSENGRQVIIHPSPLGLVLRGHDFTRSLRLEEAGVIQTISDHYELLHGKRRLCVNNGRGITLRFKNVEGVAIEIEARAYDDGIAFRYRLPGGLPGRQTVEVEETGFALLFRTADGTAWGLITEAGLEATYCGTRLSNTAQNGVYHIAFPNPLEGNGVSSEKPSADLPWVLPWRVLVLGTLRTIVESTLVTDVSPASKVADTSWIKPGRVAWSWWSDNPSPKSATKQKQFVDLAATMGWEYVLVDANWTIMDDGNVSDVIRYAREKNVGTLLWYNSGGPHNVVTEKPRDCFTYAPVRAFEFNWLAEQGVKGVKIDFFQSDKQDVISLYQGILHDAAQKKIMVNFHGCTLPRGWERTYPHLMSMEAVRGEECYIFDQTYPKRAPVQNTILPFTRNAVGPMDYTPVGLTDNRYPHLTTWAHELALPVIFETGWLHFTDRAEAYLNLPEIPKQFAKEVPVTWDETRFVAGYPGQYIIIARRHGDRWYLAGINGSDQPRAEKLTLPAWIGANAHQLTLIADGSTPRSFSTDQRNFRSGDPLELNLLPFGGFIAVIR